MAELLADPPAVAIVEEVDLTLDVAAATAAEDFDFDLGGGAELKRDDGDGPSSSLTKIEIGPDPDEINYEEEAAAGHDDAVPEPEQNDAPAAHDEGADEIDYEDTEVHAATTAAHEEDDRDAAQSHDIDASEHHDASGEHSNDIDFGFDDDGGDSHAEHGEDHGEHDHHGENDHGEYDQEDDGSHQHDEEDEDKEMAESRADDAEDEEDEDEGNDENRPQHIELDHDDSDGSGHGYDDDDEDNESVLSLGTLQSFYPVSTFDVIVTWGDQVCPLFKTPGVEDPDSFYLDDYEAMNYPLSKFLQTIRSSISNWVRSSDEILLRVDELGLEFGETTTEALLSQVTFHNLLALHNTLVKNDDAEATKGVHITLSTRSNCLLRLKDLVGGAGSGRGLSAFPSATSRADDSSDDSGEADADSDDSSPDGGDAEEPDEIVEEDDDEEIEDEIEEEDVEEDVEMARSLDEEESIASQNFADAVVKEAVRSELDTPTADEDADAQEEADYISYTHDEVDDSVEGVHLGPDGVTDLPTPHADVGDEFEFATAEDNLIDGLAADEAKLDQVDDLDLLEDINDAGDIVSHDQEGGAVVDTADLEGGQQENPEDDFLDLSGDIDDTAASAATLEAGNKADDLDTSATATLDNDEIDYEDSGATNGNKAEATADTVVDEIDWDVEIKNTAPADATETSPNASGKRTREVDETGDALLDDVPGEPPLKK
ncbi:hypothetical protein Sste5346_003232 [Sporothrix stenoceras]|uniref:Uncharacterized protein n=1 Tax=Sporothrix stenoceras TaxID=5173 RepID=A0ABR3ZEU9_9PEZI